MTQRYKVEIVLTYREDDAPDPGGLLDAVQDHIEDHLEGLLSVRSTKCEVSVEDIE